MNLLSGEPGAFPRADIRLRGVASRAFRERSVPNLREAIRFVRDLPYGRPTDPSAPLAVLDEGRGTCSTKHALLARLFAEQELSGIRLTLGIYTMTEQNTPGVGEVLAEHGLEGIPEAHCYLLYDGRRFDFTRREHKEASIGRFVAEETIEPSGIGEYKTRRHRTYLVRWSRHHGRDVDPEEIWRIREQCIAALSRRRQFEDVTT